MCTSSNEYNKNYKFNFNTLYQAIPEEITVYCRCGCGEGLSANFKFVASDGDVYIQTVVPGFYAHQFSIWNRIKRRLYAAWRMLIGKEYLLHEIALDQERWNAFVMAVNEMDIEYRNQSNTNT